MLRWISEFISQRYCATRYNDSQSSFKQIHAGLPQGAVSSTTLFNIFINDLLPTLEKTGVKVAAFADDIVIWKLGKSKESQQLQRDINKALQTLSKWCTENLMVVNEATERYQQSAANP
ncbi:hypothetical protein M8J77_003824 [Diaphorina citri]|jgi:Reverse transcriptase (RNA-dependent DNA polymerase).|nr:hypothetical protein M8J77_003824 [Diaphorina citri]